MRVGEFFSNGELVAACRQITVLNVKELVLSSQFRTLSSNHGSLRQITGLKVKYPFLTSNKAS